MAILVPDILCKLPPLLVAIRLYLASSLLDPWRLGGGTSSWCGVGGLGQLHPLCLQHLWLHFHLPVQPGDPAHNWLRLQGNKPQVHRCSDFTMLPVYPRCHYTGKLLVVDDFQNNYSLSVSSQHIIDSDISNSIFLTDNIFILVIQFFINNSYIESFRENSWDIEFLCSDILNEIKTFKKFKYLMVSETVSLWSLFALKDDHINSAFEILGFKGNVKVPAISLFCLFVLDWLWLWLGCYQCLKIETSIIDHPLSFYSEFYKP